MKNNKKIPLGSLISTILIGVYMMFSLCAGIGSLFLVRYAGELTTVGMNLATNPGENGDYISGYLILPGSLTALLGGMTGVVAFLVVVGLVLLFVIFLILIPVFITGGIHLDGFLDTQDALSSWQTKERRLEILKDSHAGAFAIISCTVYFLMYIGVYSCLSVRSMEVIAYSFMLSRTLSGLSVVTFPQARKKGMVADFSESASTRITRMVLGIYLIVLCFLIPLTGGICGIGCVISAGVVFGYYYRMSRKQFGGVTGDLAGYFLQICELALLVGGLIVQGIK